MQSNYLKLNCITLVWMYLCNRTEIQYSRIVTLVLHVGKFRRHGVLLVDGRHRIQKTLPAVELLEGLARHQALRPGVVQKERGLLAHKKHSLI